MLRNFTEGGGTVDLLLMAAGELPGTTSQGTGIPRRANLKQLVQGLVALETTGKLRFSNARASVNGLGFENGQALFGNVTLEILHPVSSDLILQGLGVSTNDAAFVLRISSVGYSVLLAADVGGNGWVRIRDRGTDLRADVLRMPHHGGTFGGGVTIDDLLDMVRPSAVVLSVGSTNQYKHPAVATLSTLRARIGPNKVRILCTQATPRCHSLSPMPIRAAVQAIRATSFSMPRPRGWCPCAGMITAILEPTGVSILPAETDHARVIALFNTPQCQLGLGQQGGNSAHLSEESAAATSGQQTLG